MRRMRPRPCSKCGNVYVYSTRAKKCRFCGGKLKSRWQEFRDSEALTKKIEARAKELFPAKRGPMQQVLADILDAKGERR